MVKGADKTASIFINENVSHQLGTYIKEDRCVLQFSVNIICELPKMIKLQHRTNKSMSIHNEIFITVATKENQINF